MWVTQSYLATVEPDAKVFIYYLFENYNDKQMQITEHVQRELERMGDIYNNDVSLLMPNPNYADRVEAEVREIRPLWELVYGELPALLILNKPMVKLDHDTKHCIIVPFKDKTPKSVASTIEKVRKLTERTLNLAIEQTSTKSGWKEKFGESVELKPGIFGFRLDLRKLFS